MTRPPHWPLLVMGKVPSSGSASAVKTISQVGEPSAKRRAPRSTISVAAESAVVLKRPFTTVPGVMVRIFPVGTKIFLSRIQFLVQSKIVLLAVRSPSLAPPLTANVDSNTDGLDDTGGHPQSEPRFVCAKP